MHFPVQPPPGLTRRPAPPSRAAISRAPPPEPGGPPRRWQCVVPALAPGCAAEEEAAAPEVVSFVVPRENVETVTRALGHAMDRLEGKNRRARGLVLMSEEYVKAHGN